MASTLLFAPAAYGESCPTWGPGEQIGHLDNEDVDESSGLADSWLRGDILWTHNDSGDLPRLFLILKEDARIISEIRLEGAQNIDWEDMAIAPCEPGDETPCIYVGDIGDNLARYSHRTIYRFAEPELSDPIPAQITIETFDRLDFVYPDGPRDAEVLLVHPKTSEIYVIEKSSAETSHVYRIPANFNEPEPIEAELIATLSFESGVAFGRMTTAGDISPDGREFTLRTYLHLYVYCAGEDDFESAFGSRPEPINQRPLTIQGEALTYDRQDGALWLTSERTPAPLIRVPPRETREIPPEDEGDIGLEQADPEPDFESFPDAEPVSEPDVRPVPVDSAASKEESSSCTCATQSVSRRSGILPMLIMGLVWVWRMKRRFSITLEEPEIHA
ncbi:MAG: hypothetical protein ACNA8W_17600 [Bradymonadaceae bacterium]